MADETLIVEVGGETIVTVVQTATETVQVAQQLGYSGYSGISGYSGYSGISGASGISGYSGASGYSGGGVFSVGEAIVNSGGVETGNYIVWIAPFACTVTSVKGYRVGGTGATINARNEGANNHLSSALSLTSADAWMDGGAVQNTAYSAGHKLEIMVVTAVGNPTQIAIQINFTKP